ncbi:hypothetical protein P4C99_09905 [Pontiellaceae bacterium B1224]|nr:hypothetical protein [Pontiellaceae bacterium B1224]
MKKIIAIITVCIVCSSFAAPVFKGKDGLVIMEAESTESSKGDWQEKKTVAGYTGECHFEFTGNKPATGPAQDPLEYTFTVDKDGIYTLMIRCHKRLEDEAPDKCNDCYVRLEGDFDVGGNTPLDILTSDTKLYGGSADGWGWSEKLDVQHKKWPAVYKLKAGEKYTLTISGRSQRYNMDRIIFKHSDVKDEQAKNPKQLESQMAD